MILHDNATADLGTAIHSPPRTSREQTTTKTLRLCCGESTFLRQSVDAPDSIPSHDEYARFGYGIPPTKNGDYAFLLHFIASLKSKGKGAIILPHGVLFRGNKEADIRRNLIRRGYIKGIIGLPANLFYGTGIPACIIVIDKENAGHRHGIFMIDASKDFLKDGNKNRLRAQDIHKIVSVFKANRPKSRAIPYGADLRNCRPCQRL